MKNYRSVLFAFFVTVSAFALVTYTSCTKDPCSGVVCVNGGSCSGGSCVCPAGYAGARCENLAITAIVYQNNTFTPIRITVNGVTNVIPVGNAVEFDGAYGDQLTGSAVTSGATSSGTIIGLPISWTLQATFPAEGSLTQNLDVTQDYFFLKVINTSAYSLQTLYVNYGLVSQTTDNIIIPNNGVTYGTGYYQAYTNSNVRLESASNYWSFSSLAIPFTSNQSVTVIAN